MSSGWRCVSAGVLALCMMLNAAVAAVATNLKGGAKPVSAAEVSALRRGYELPDMRPMDGVGRRMQLRPVRKAEKKSEAISARPETILPKLPVVIPQTGVRTNAARGKDNTPRGWYFRAAKPAGVGKPAGIPDDVRALIEEFGGVWQAPAGQMRMYLTFDEGYEYGENTAAILDTLKEKGVKACFFITGHYLKSRPDLVARMIQEGHDVANHTTHHYNGPQAVRTPGKLEDDIASLAQAYRNAFGIDMMPWMRPPEGAYSQATLAVIRSLGYRPVFWSFAYRDWETKSQPDPKQALARITGQFHDGSILLLHAVSVTNTQILGKVIDAAYAQGYTFGTLRDLPGMQDGKE